MRSVVSIGLALTLVACGVSADPVGDSQTSALGTCGAAGAPFGAPVLLSDPAVPSLLPVVAARSDGALVAWQEFVDGGSRVALMLLHDGCAQSAIPLPDSLPFQKRPNVVATASGYAIAYEAREGEADRVRVIWLAPDGALVGGPETIGDGVMPQIAAAGDELAFAWLAGGAHFYARRGATENVAARRVGTTLITTTILNYPRIALDAGGTLHLAYRDGGTSAADWDVRVLDRPRGGIFGPAANISSSPARVSDDIALALEPDGTLDVAWVEQNASDPNAFDVTYRTRRPGTSFSPPRRFAQGLWTWTPSIVPGLGIAWRSGQGAVGPFHFASAAGAPIRVAAPDVGSAPRLAREPGGALHLVYNDGARQVRYARGL